MSRCGNGGGYGPPSPESARVSKEMRRLHEEEGVSMYQLARRFQMSRQAVAKRIRKAGGKIGLRIHHREDDQSVIGTTFMNGIFSWNEVARRSGKTVRQVKRIISRNKMYRRAIRHFILENRKRREERYSDIVDGLRSAALRCGAVPTATWLYVNEPRLYSRIEQNGGIAKFRRRAFPGLKRGSPLPPWLINHETAA